MHEQPPPTSISSYLPRLLSQAATYEAADAELAETIDMLRRATAILEKEMAKTGFIQTDAIDKVADALSRKWQPCKTFVLPPWILHVRATLTPVRDISTTSRSNPDGPLRKWHK